MIWIIAYALAGLVVAVVALAQMAPFDSHGDRACGGMVGLFAAAVWPVLVAGWLLARTAEFAGDLVDRTPHRDSYHVPPVPDYWMPERGFYHTSIRPPFGPRPPTDEPTSEEPRR